MAKGKKRSSEGGLVEQGASVAVADASPPGVAARFIGQWNRLVSTTNWEKGRIICQLRDALVADGASAAAYSDEAWAQLVGGVTSQHVGRLRRVFQRFGDVSNQYEGLYWSHFQAGLDWEDAEMWLEGAIHNGWSVSQMRGKRWETLGTPGEAPPGDDAVEVSELDDASEVAMASGDESLVSSTPSAVRGVESPARRERVDESSDESLKSEDASGKGPGKLRKRLGVDVDDLPSDLADAFEQFKLAIIAQRRLGWSETTPEAVLECLDALRELTLAPGDD